MKQKLLKTLYKILAFFSNHYLKKSNPFVIWVTGSVWKTSARTIITQVLRDIEMEKYNLKSNTLSYQNRLNEATVNVMNYIYTSPKNFNSEIGLILSIFKIEEYDPTFLNLLKISIYIIKRSIFSKPWYWVIILEYWIDHPWDMDFLLSVVVPDVSVFTKLDKVHSSFFESADAIWDEKFKLMLATKKTVFLNYTDDYCLKNSSKIQVPIKFYFGGDVIISNIKVKEKDSVLHTKFEYNWQKISTNIFWEENLNYIALALEISNFIFNEWKIITEWDFEIDDLEENSILNWVDQISIVDTKKEKIEKILVPNNFEITLQAWRFGIFQWIWNSILIDSSYNSAPESMKLMIKNTFSLRDDFYLDYKIGFVVWDMRELWESSEQEHKNLAQYLEKADFVVTVWNETKKYLFNELEGKIPLLTNFVSSKKAWIFVENILKEHKHEKYIILFKWSQNTIFIEEALKEVLLNEIDKKKLVRQNQYWIKKKNDFFK